MRPGKVVQIHRMHSVGFGAHMSNEDIDFFNILVQRNLVKPGWNLTDDNLSSLVNIWDLFD